MEAGESARDAAAREAQEEAGVQLVSGDLQSAGHVLFEFPAKRGWNQRVDIFVTWQWTGEIVDSDEIKPIWHAVPALPFSDYVG